MATVQAKMLGQLSIARPLTKASLPAKRPASNSTRIGEISGNSNPVRSFRRNYTKVPSKS
jgi:hypothetical protein